MLSVPVFLRPQATVIRLTRFQADKVEAMHK
jgi:hypothetical protein